MALDFDAGTEKVDCGNIANISAGTAILWLWQDTKAANMPLLVKMGTTPWGENMVMWANSGGNDLYCKCSRATTDLEASCASFLTAGQWDFIAFAWDDTGVNGDQEIYHGTLSALATEVGAYVDQEVGAGARDAQSENFYIGGIESNQGWNGADHKIAVAALFDAKLTLGQIQSFQYRSRSMNNCVGLWLPGLHGSSTVPDLSGNGNTGTITGATVTDHIPLGPPFGFDVGVPYVVAAAGGLSIPVAMHHYTKNIG